MVRIEQLSKSYGRKQALDGVSLSFQKGRVHGVAGENGAGKTTLFRCIAGLEPYTGTIHSEYDSLKGHLGFLQAEPFFFPRITGEEYIRLMASARQKKIAGLESKNLFGLPLGQYASSYSTGMKKKLALTAILLQENEVLILDEPFSGVDIQSNLVIVEVISRLRALNKTVIISSHIFAALSEVCDEISLLRSGRILQTAGRSGFSSLEAEMKAVTIGSRIDQLELK
ncbi:ABC transporter ATP-binding protein [Phaeodactylibacter luteus]|uniref:ATP-binding cassette domain-containing protein n=1 Tax=Phaeodactylibacter luteus TaxID=1564516 RepID=A0A5C6RQ17_9BACT|nr:ATP-binding cassette domain-containing protein [Phaeodactylibacter luteus]TXB63750.1 ATP-binding cassette domain-containing protein [Phaeodactylibacter luteus]